MNKKLAQAFAHCAHQAASADNAQPWFFRSEGDRFIIAYDTQRVAQQTFPPLNPATLLAIGGCVENIESYAQAAKLDMTCEYPLAVRDGSPDGRFEFVRVTARQDTGSGDSLPVPNFCRHTNRHPFYSTPVPQSMLKRILNWTRGSAKATVLTQVDHRTSMRKAVQDASEIRFQTREVHEWLGKSLRFAPQDNAQDGLDVRTLALPPGGTQLMRLISDWRRMALLNKFGFYKLLSAVDSAPVGKGPALIAITGGTDATEVINSGKLLNAVWTELNREGLAVHPYYVIPDLLHRIRHHDVPERLQSQAKSVEQRVTSLLNLEKGTTLHMLLRVGHPTRRHIPSRRLPMDVVFPEAFRNSVTLLD